MTTGIQASLSGVATMTYTPTTNAKVLVSINGSGAASVSINGVTGLATASVLSNITTYVGAGQTYTLTTVASSTASVSSLEDS